MDTDWPIQRSRKSRCLSGSRIVRRTDEDLRDGVRLIHHEVQVERWRAVLVTDDEHCGALGGPDGHGRGVVEEVLVAAEPSLRVVRQGPDGLVLGPDRAGDRDVARGEWNPHGDADPHARVEQAEDDADRQDEEEPATPEGAASIAISGSCSGGFFAHLGSAHGWGVVPAKVAYRGNVTPLDPPQADAESPDHDAKAAAMPFAVAI